MAAALVLTEIASAGSNGPIISGLNAATLAELAADRLFNYPAFLQKAQSLVNASVTQAENALPEGERVQLVLPNLRGPFGGSLASEMAAAITQAWAKGELINVDGTTLQPWPGTSAIAFPNDATATLTLQWVKGQPWVWLVVAALVALTALFVYLSVHASNYSLSRADQSGGTVAINPVAFVLRNWPWFLLGAGALVAAPFAVRQFGATEEAEAQERRARADLRRSR